MSSGRSFALGKPAHHRPQRAARVAGDPAAHFAEQPGGLVNAMIARMLAGGVAADAPKT